ncbi:hypothetical protein Tsp_15203, partial [Trichinella spiralis]|uniref:hypothetical protein n=1 Tax=Trichinella spiralis TaxID=6334 RepID=UPI0001EFE2C0
SDNFETHRVQNRSPLQVVDRVVPIYTTSTCVLNISIFLSTDTDLIILISFLWFLFSHTVSALYTGIKQDPSSRGLLRSSKKYTIVFVYVIPYANSQTNLYIVFTILNRLETPKTATPTIRTGYESSNPFLIGSRFLRSISQRDDPARLKRNLTDIEEILGAGFHQHQTSRRESNSRLSKR